MFFIGVGADDVTDDHEGFVAGRYRDGTVSDIWTDVGPVADDTFVGYLPACECGWYGAERACDDSGYRASQSDWLRDHFAPDVAARRQRETGGPINPNPPVSDFDWGSGRAPGREPEPASSGAAGELPDAG